MRDHSYNTRRKAELLDYLQAREGQHVTAADIRAHFAALGAPIGTATIYRQLDHLMAAGVVQKYTTDDQGPACFAYVGSGHCHDVCIHCKCVQCGTLLHLQCQELEHLQGHLAHHHGFSLQFPRTVLYGLCAQCGEAQA